MNTYQHYSMENVHYTKYSRNKHGHEVSRLHKHCLLKTTAAKSLCYHLKRGALCTSLVLPGPLNLWSAVRFHPVTCYYISFIIRVCMNLGSKRFNC